SYLADTRFEPTEQLEAYEEATNGTEQLARALAQLDDRSRDIIASRWLSEPKQTLHELAGKYKVSAERIRQIENNAFNTLKRGLAPQQLAMLPAKP
ncbi:MAG: hypothetical protein IT493_11935, partial [Gammaproteobacteria bacterium]|nr:hypothetical protein [Gammaproteobacteria bacterium]